MLAGGAWASGGNGASSDAFGRLRVGNPATLFENQFTYSLQPLIFEQIVAGSGAAIAHDATNRNALLTFASTPNGGRAIMQSYQHIPYQPSKGQLIFVTFNMIEAVANTIKFAGYSDGTNGYEFILNGTTPAVRVLSSSNAGNQTVNQSAWNLDKMNGTGKSGITLDFTKSQILVIDFQALYVGRVRFGFDIGGHIYYVHEFLNANTIVHPYIATANLPIRVGMTCSGTVSTTMKFQCCSVVSEGGTNRIPGFENVAEGTVTASSGARTHLLSVRPKTTFNSIANRSGFELDNISLLVTGSSPILWELCVGQAISGTTAFNDVNATYSSCEFNTLGTISGAPAYVLDSGYVAATNQNKGQVDHQELIKAPITLDAAGAVRALGTISLIVTGIGGASACRGSMTWREMR